MFCPECRSEYREGYTKCSDCGVDLIPVLPQERRSPPPDNVALVPLFESSDEAVLMVAKSILEGAGIPYFVENARSRNMMGAGRLGGGSLITAPAVIVVREDEAAAAAELLKDLRSGMTGGTWKTVDPGEAEPLE
jgi:hypothetical protein